MAGQLLLRCRSSSSPSPAFRFISIIPNLSTFYRAFSATQRSNLHSDNSSEWAEAESSELWEEFKSWILKHKKIYRTKEVMLDRFKIFIDLKDIEKFNNELAEAKSSKQWKLFEPWMSKYNKRYRSDKEMLYRFNIFANRLKDIERLNKEYEGCTFGLNRYSDLTENECFVGDGRRVLFRKSRSELPKLANEENPGRD